MPLPYRDRAEPGRLLAERLRSYQGRPEMIVLGLPRGGVSVAYEVARMLQLPLDIFVVRKLGVPGQPELAMGAIATGGVRVLNNEVVRLYGIDPEEIDAVTAREMRELERREEAYRGLRPPPDLTGRTAIVVDDGLATGSTMLAAVKALRKAQAAGIVVAVPVAAARTCESFQHHADDVICLETPEPFRAVGLWYEDFTDLSDGQIRGLLEEAAQAAATEPRP
ncbi:MAG: phosphoribosyltransferase [Bryobacteraceae bacterium]